MTLRLSALRPTRPPRPHPRPFSRREKGEHCLFITFPVISKRQGFPPPRRLLSPPPLGGGGCPGRGGRGRRSLSMRVRNQETENSCGASRRKVDALSRPCRATLPRRAWEGKANGVAAGKFHGPIMSRVSLKDVMKSQLPPLTRGGLGRGLRRWSRSPRPAVMVVATTPGNERCFPIMERGRPARKENHEAGETPTLQCSFTLTEPPSQFPLNESFPTKKNFR
jgi:hypothetical protein